MGGFNSGGHNWKGRPTVEQCYPLLINTFSGSGALSKGTAGTYQFPSLLLHFFCEYEDAVVISFLCPKTADQKTQLIGFQAISELHQRHFGGFQAYWVCPQCCENRSKLYLFKSRFLCRQCHSLPYSSQRKRLLERMLLKVEKAQRKLGAIKTGIDYGVPLKPSRMRQANYYRHARVINEATRTYEGEFERCLLRRFPGMNF